VTLMVQLGARGAMEKEELYPPATLSSRPRRVPKLPARRKTSLRLLIAFPYRGSLH
jgi:hypothetical protein